MTKSTGVGRGNNPRSWRNRPRAADHHRWKQPAFRRARVACGNPNRAQRFPGGPLMAAPTTLAECREAYAADAMPNLPTHVRVRLQRAFMAGAMSAVQLEKSGVPREALLAELLGFARAIGSEVERAL
jgi:hypothetical protein